MIVSIFTGQIAGRLGCSWLVEGQPEKYSTYPHVIETEDGQSTSSIALAAAIVPTLQQTHD